MFENLFDKDTAKELDNFKLIQEIRIRTEKKLCVIDNTGIHKLDLYITPELIERIFCSMCNYSVYAMQEEIKNGFITLPQGHRAGICGRCVVCDGKVLNISEISGINIRIAREIKNCAYQIFKVLSRQLENTVIISPPNCGKTTYLRDVTRLVSNSGINVSIVDERGEISPFYNSKSVFDLGENTDVLRFCPKHKGMMMVLRSMNPEIIVTDETGSDTECEAISEITRCGVKIFTTFHGYSILDFKSRFKEWRMFHYAVLLNRKKEVEDLVCLK